MRPNTSTNICARWVLRDVSFPLKQVSFVALALKGTRRGYETTLRSDKKYRVILQDISNAIQPISSDSFSNTRTAATYSIPTDRSCSYFSDTFLMACVGSYVCSWCCIRATFIHYFLDRKSMLTADVVRALVSAAVTLFSIMLCVAKFCILLFRNQMTMNGDDNETDNAYNMHRTLVRSNILMK